MKPRRGASMANQQFYRQARPWQGMAGPGQARAGLAQTIRVRATRHELAVMFQLSGSASGVSRAARRFNFLRRGLVLQPESANTRCNGLGYANTGWLEYPWYRLQCSAGVGFRYTQPFLSLFCVLTAATSATLVDWAVEGPTSLI